MRKALVCIGDSIFRGQPPVITWFRIVALFAVSSAVAREVVVNGNAHLVPVVVTTFTELVDRYLAVWIYRQGGWVGYEPLLHTRNASTQNFGIGGAGVNCKQTQCPILSKIFFEIVEYIRRCNFVLLVDDLPFLPSFACC